MSKLIETAVSAKERFDSACRALWAGLQTGTFAAGNGASRARRRAAALPSRDEARETLAGAFRAMRGGSGRAACLAGVPAAIAVLMLPAAAMAATDLDDIVGKWTDMFTDVRGSVVKLLAAAAVVAILILLLIGLFSNDPMERKRMATAIVTILIICAVAAVAISLVNWAFGKDIVSSAGSKYIS